jgi:hypothetical protein
MSLCPVPRAAIPVYAVIVAVAVSLIGRQMMRVCRAAARSFHPIGNRGAVCPLVVSACGDGSQGSEDRNQTPHTASRAYALSNETPTDAFAWLENQAPSGLHLPAAGGSFWSHSPTSFARRQAGQAAKVVQIVLASKSFLRPKQPLPKGRWVLDPRCFDSKSVIDSTELHHRLVCLFSQQRANARL